MNDEYIYQPEIWWFDPADTLPPSEEDRAWWCNPENPENPFSKFIGNRQGVRRLCRSAFAAFGRYNRECSDQSFALLGPASTGKTTLARMYAQLIGLPFVEIDSNSCNDINDIAFAIAKVLENTKIENNPDYDTLELQDLGNNEIMVPPCIVFIDEVHNLPKKVEQGLLKATEKKDSKLFVTKRNGDTITFDTAGICWMIATTDRGSLFDAFDTRFSKIHLKLYTLDEIAQIIHINNPDWDMDVCKIVAKYAGRVPREALAFAHEMRLEGEMSDDDDDWENVAARVAEDNNIDPMGMTYQRLSILTALGQGPIAKGNLGGIVDCKQPELIKFVMPPLLATTADQLPLVKITSKGYAITKAGLDELDKRSISYDPSLASGATLSNRLTRNNNN
jgi:Holliday junction resolvasome RuvABC ATP-dependent DNA helicase subunit